MDREVEISIVVPVYGCDGCLRALHRRVTETLEGMLVDFELLLVDDRSPDGSWEVMRELAEQDSRVRLLRLSRNFGQQAAITAGLSRSRGRWTVVMDCDLQDPPELIPELYETARNGHDVVFARRAARSHSFVRTVPAKVYAKLIRIFVGVEVQGEYGAYTIISRRARETLLTLRDVDRHYVPMLLWIGFDQTSIDYEHADRYAGESSYSVAALFKHALTGMLFHSTTMLRWIVYTGLSFAFAGLLLAAYLVINYFLVSPLPGWTSLAVLILVTSGFIALSAGVTGLYVGGVFRQVKARPLFVIDREIQGTEDSQITALPSSELSDVSTR